MQVLGLKMPLIKPGDDLPSLIVKAAEQVDGLCDDDIIVISSKVVATIQGRLRGLDKVRPSARARRLAAESRLEPEFVELVLREADQVYGAVKGAILTLKDGMLCANAGVDHSNAPPGQVVLMPSKPNRVAKELREALVKLAKAKLGLIIVDSNVKPLRLGTVGQAIGFAGLEPVIDMRGKLDLYGRPLHMTFRAIADQLATAAQVVMSEADERVPVVVVRDSDVELVEKTKRSLKVPPDKCIYFNSFKLPKN